METALNIMYAGCLYPHSFSTPTARSTLQPHHTPSMYHTLYVRPTHPPHAPSTPPSSSACNYLLFCFLLCLHRLNYDLLGEPSTVDPSLLCPAERLQWNISSETAKDIDIAKKNLDKCVCALASFQDSHHQESLGRRLCTRVCALCCNLPRETSSPITRIIREILANIEVCDRLIYVILHSWHCSTSSK